MIERKWNRSKSVGSASRLVARLNRMYGDTCDDELMWETYERRYSWLQKGAKRVNSRLRTLRDFPCLPADYDRETEGVRKALITLAKGGLNWREIDVALLMRSEINTEHFKSLPWDVQSPQEHPKNVLV
jgi:hypothetical protein